MARSATKIHFKVYSLLHKLCHRPLGRRSRWLWWCTVDTVDTVDTAAAAAAATVAVDKLAPSLAAGSLACLFTSSYTDGCTVLMCLCRLFIEPAAHEILSLHPVHCVSCAHFLTFPACMCSVVYVLSLSLFH